MKKLLAFLIFVSFATAAGVWTIDSTTNCIDNSTVGIFAEQGVLISIVIAFTILLIAITYMIGTVFTNANFLVFSKDEMYHLGFSIVFLMAFSGILIGTCYTMEGFSQLLLTNLGTTFGALSCNSASMNDVAYCYLDKLSQDAEDITKSYVDRQISEMMDSSFAWSFAMPLVNSYTLTGAAYKRIRSSQYEMIFSSLLIPALVSINMQKLMLGFIKENIVQWLLPVAFLLRIFIPTRQMGDLLIALCLGIYIIIPFMYVFELAMYDIIDEDDCDDFEDAVCDRVVDGGCSGGGNACSNSIGFWNVGKLLPFAFFFPNLTIVIIVAFMNAVHKGLRAIG
ncbi:MAG: hypothetical protein ABH842_04765 [Candidatus Micrarchaeota archaeon]